VWDDVTSRDFRPKSLFNRPDPMTVLRESSDGDARAKAMRSIKEPRQVGGSDAEQEEVIRLLTTSAVGDAQPLCRMEAVKALGRFRDPRAVTALISAYEAAGQMPADVSGAIQGQALAALGETKQPTAVAFLVRASQKDLPADASDRDRQQARDIRLAAVRALRNFEGSNEVATATAQLAQSDKDVALRDRARETYVKVTGNDPPNNPVAPPTPQELPKPGGGVQLTGGTQPKP
jgi:HEAT repeat protein